MPELPDIVAYIDALEARITGQPLDRVRLGNPFLLRTIDPPVAEIEGRVVRELRRVGKRIAIGVEGDLWLVLHLMIAGRLHWRPPQARLAGRQNLAAFDFPHGTLTLTEAGTKRRASLHLLRGQENLGSLDAGGIDVFTADPAAFKAALTSENHTLKRALTDPRLLSGIGNAYSDEILHAAQLSPISQTQKLKPEEWDRLFAATSRTLVHWIERLRAEARESFPEHVTAFRKDMAVHGRYGEPCPQVRRQSAAHSLCGQGDELLRALPDGRKGIGRSQLVTAFGVGLAAHPGGTGSADQEVTAAVSGVRSVRRSDPGGR